MPYKQNIYLSCATVSRPCQSRIKMLLVVISMMRRLLKVVSKRVTVSRDEPIICAISSWLKDSRFAPRTPTDLHLPWRPPEKIAGQTAFEGGEVLIS